VIPNRVGVISWDRGRPGRFERVTKGGRPGRGPGEGSESARSGAFRSLALAVVLLALPLPAADPPADLKAPGPLSPKDERATFRVAPGFTVELVAAEPDVVDPVAMCFDERGRLFVAEMRGYPNGGVGTGTETRGRIRCLTDADGDGRFETATTFADGLRFPMGLQPYKGGLIVAVAPDLVYLEDANGDGRADKSAVLYTGFNLANIQQMVNSLRWGLDNWVYGCAGNDGGTVRSAEKPGSPEVSLRNRGLRFRPWQPGSLEPTSGGGQYGLTADDYGRWFTATNSQHLRQVVLPDEYLRHNPYLPVPTVTVDIPEHGPAAKVFRVSPFEPWRVERTARRAGGADARRFPSTELVPGGYITSACSPLVYTADLFPPAYRGNNFVCDPANNLIHRETLEPNGVLFTAKRADAGREFLASTDNWFRPVHLSVGPDGAVYVLDFYREVIETPLSLPDDIKKRLDLESRGRGRVWRVAPEGFEPGKRPDLSRAAAGELADALTRPNPWWRLTAQRLLVERQAKDAAPAIRERIAGAVGQPGHANLLWALDGLGELTPADLGRAWDDPEPGMREQALRLAERFFGESPDVRRRAAALAEDRSARVRFQLGLSAGRMPPGPRADLLATLLAREADPWVRTAALISAGEVAVRLIDRLGPNADRSVFSRLAVMVGAKGDGTEVARVLARVADGAGGREAALLSGLGEGMRNARKPLAAWLADPPAGAKPVVAKLRQRFEAAAAAVRDGAGPAAERVAAADLLALVPFDLAGPALADALTPTAPGDVQAAAVRALAAHPDAGVAPLLLEHWAGYGPALRATVLDALAARPDRAAALLDAVAAKAVAAGELPPALVQQLKTHPTEAVRRKAAAVLDATVNPDRARVVASYAGVIDLKPDPARGKGLFQAHCAACHRLDGVGHEVGPNLLAALPGKSAGDLLVALFDPNREVDPRYVGYQATTADGRVLTGIVSAETPAGVTLRRADGAEETVRRADLESLRSTRLSLMPDGLEGRLAPQDVADLFGYLRAAGR
jgi:putative membrane-bound dehydrogenase-like protein